MARIKKPRSSMDVAVDVLSSWFNQVAEMSALSNFRLSAFTYRYSPAGWIIDDLTRLALHKGNADRDYCADLIFWTANISDFENDFFRPENRDALFAALDFLSPTPEFVQDLMSLDKVRNEAPARHARWDAARVLQAGHRERGRRMH